MKTKTIKKAPVCYPAHQGESAEHLSNDVKKHGGQDVACEEIEGQTWCCSYEEITTDEDED